MARIYEVAGKQIDLDDADAVRAATRTWLAPENRAALEHRPQPKGPHA